MKYSWTVCVLILFAITPAAGFGIESYNSVCYEGTAPFLIDGDLSDWQLPGMEAVQLTFDSMNSPQKPQDANDFSASFRCCADRDFVYVAVDVKDDVLVFGEEKMGKAFWDDSVLIHFPTPWKENFRSSIALSLDEQGNEKLEYYESPVDQRYPYILGEMGVTAHVRQNGEGYSAEIAIPHRLMGLNVAEDMVGIDMNVEVFDDDDGEDHESALLLDFKGWWHPDWYYTHVFLEKIPVQPGTETVTSQPDESGEAQELEVVLGAPDQTLVLDTIYSVLYDTSHENWESAEIKLSSYGSVFWAAPVLSWVQIKQNKTDEAIQTLHRIADETRNESLDIWAQDLLGLLYKSKRDS